MNATAEALIAAEAALATREKIPDETSSYRVRLAYDAIFVAELRLEADDAAGARLAIGTARQAISDVADAEIEDPFEREILVETRATMATVTERLDQIE